jgi:alpha-N-arabinofuranosidase
MNLDPYKNRSTYDHSFENAWDWIEYVNGDVTTPYGALRAEHGHPEPYGVKLWCIGNENYYPHNYHTPEPAEFYAANLASWAKAFKTAYPELSLLGVGRTPDWTRVILDKSGEYIDYVTIHYYIQSYINGDGSLREDNCLFSSAVVEANLKQNIEVLKAANAKFGREDNPIRFSVDEWNNRHKPQASGWNTVRGDDRRQYDVITTSTMLNVFLRNAPYVGMANYIFPVNGHGLLKTVGENDAYRSAIYYVFDLYRKYLVGNLMGVYVEGAGLPMVRLGDYVRQGNAAWLDGDIDTSTYSIVQDLCFVDATATMNDNGDICIALSNRSHNKAQNIELDLPEGYAVAEVWSLESKNITAVNTSSNRDVVQSKRVEVTDDTLSLLPCGLKIVRCVKEE